MAVAAIGAFSFPDNKKIKNTNATNFDNFYVQDSVLHTATPRRVSTRDRGRGVFTL